MSDWSLAINTTKGEGWEKMSTFLLVTVLLQLKEKKERHFLCSRLRLRAWGHRFWILKFTIRPESDQIGDSTCLLILSLKTMCGFGIRPPSTPTSMHQLFSSALSTTWWSRCKSLVWVDYWSKNHFQSSRFNIRNIECAWSVIWDLGARLNWEENLGLMSNGPRALT